MKLLLLLSLIILASGDEAFVAERAAEDNDVSLQATTVLQAQPSSQEIIGEKKLGKRSYGFFPSTYVGSYTPVLPWYKLGNHGGYSGWYSGWPWLYGGYGGWHGGWYKGW